MADEKSVPWQNKTIMLAAVAAAVVAVVLNYVYIHSIENKTEEQQAPVWMVSETMTAGRRLTVQDVVEGRIPAAKPEDARPFVRAGEKSEFSSIKNLPLRRRVDKGEPLRWDMFTEGGERVAEDAISPLWRSVTIQVDGGTATPLVRPGSKIDLFGMLRLNGNDDKPLPPEVQLLMEEVEVLAVGAVWRPEEYRPGTGGGNYTRLSVLVPRQLVPDLLTILRLIPPPSYVLRNPTDSIKTGTTNDWELQAQTRLNEFKKKAQSQKVPFDLGQGNPDRL